MSFFSLSSKKGQNLSMSFIVVAAIALVVMAVVIIIFVTKANTSSDGFGSCGMSNGKCIDDTTCAGHDADGVHPQQLAGKTCPAYSRDKEKQQVCCLLKYEENK